MGPPEYDVVDTALLTLIIDFSGNYGYTSSSQGYDELRDMGFTPIADVNLITKRTKSCDDGKEEIDLCSTLVVEELLKGKEWWTWPCGLAWQAMDLDWDNDPSGTAQKLCPGSG